MRPGGRPEANMWGEVVERHHLTVLKATCRFSNVAPKPNLTHVQVLWELKLRLTRAEPCLQSTGPLNAERSM